MKRIKRALAPALALGLVAGTAPVTHAQSKGAVPVRIDFRALTEEGAQVSDLKAEDISLKVNGKPRQIKSLSLFRTTSDFALPSSQLPAPYATNAVGMNGRVIHILIDARS